MLFRSIAKKPVYFSESLKEQYLQLQYNVQESFDVAKYDEMISLIVDFTHKYFKDILKMDKLSHLELTKKFSTFENKELSSIIQKFYKKIISVAYRDYRVITNKNTIEWQAFIDEMLGMIYLVSDFTEKDAITCVDRKSTRLNSSHVSESRMPSSA